MKARSPARRRRAPLKPPPKVIFGSFEDVARHSRREAAASVKRNDAQAWAYWYMVESWATVQALTAQTLGPASDVKLATDQLGAQLDLVKNWSRSLATVSARCAVDAFSRATWCARIRKAHGLRTPLSMKFLLDLDGRAASKELRLAGSRV